MITKKVRCGSIEIKRGKSVWNEDPTFLVMDLNSHPNMYLILDEEEWQDLVDAVNKMNYKSSRKD